MGTKQRQSKVEEPAKPLTGGYDWDEEVDATSTGGGFKLLPEGPATFFVLDLKRTRKSFGKFGTINVAELTLVCNSEEDENAQADINVQLGLHHDLDWKITQFFTAIGQRNHGDAERFVPNWDRVEGSTGKCVVKNRKYKKKSDADGEMTGVSNEITEFIAPEGSEPAEDNLRF